VVVMSARPGRVLKVLDTDLETAGESRREIVTSPEFVALKEQALEAIE
jgi:ABC-type taurine transport system ATPase subunit